MLAAHMSGSQFETVANAGHSAHWERPAEWNRIVLNFLHDH
jgi:pimeloyl-ACP methyl ester carboxylesterase